MELRADDEDMIAVLILLGLVLVGFLTIRYGVDSRPVEHGYHRPNLL
jgi:hypothetical protein